MHTTREVSLLGEQTPTGHQWRLRSHGTARWAGAAFLAGWLVFWAVGEVFLLAAVTRGSLGSFLGWDPGWLPGRPVGGVPLKTFLMVWLLLWSVGGIAAGSHLATLLWGENRVLAGPDGLHIEHVRWPTRTAYDVATADIRGLYVQGSGGSVMVRTRTGVVPVAVLVNAREGAQLAARLRELLGVDRILESIPELPAGWRERPGDGGVPVLVSESVARGAGGAAAGIVGVALTLMTLLAARGWRANPGSFLLLATVAMLFVVLAAWLARGRLEVTLQDGRIDVLRRLGSRTWLVTHGTALQLSQKTDSDGDTWFTLKAVGVDARGRRRTPSIARAVNDDSMPHQLGRWLSLRAGLPLTIDPAPTAGPYRDDNQLPG